MKIASGFVALCALFALSAPEKVSPIAAGTHAPTISSSVWKVIDKDGHGSAFPVAEVQSPSGKPLVVFLTARHVTSVVVGDRIVQDLSGNRKMKVTRVAAHATKDVSLFWAERAANDAAPIKTFALAPQVDMEIGLSLFGAGYPGKLNHFKVVRGFLGSPNIVSMAVAGGMSGMPIMLNDGRVVGILSSYPVLNWKQRVVGPAGQATPLHVHRDYEYRTEAIIVPLADVAPWLKQKGVLK